MTKSLNILLVEDDTKEEADFGNAAKRRENSEQPVRPQEPGKSN